MNFIMLCIGVIATIAAAIVDLWNNSGGSGLLM